MEIRESVNYVFRYNKDSIAEKYIDTIIETQEFCYEFICKYLDVKMNDKIHYYLCESPEQVGQIYGDNEPCNAFASKPNKIYAVYNEDIKCIGFHEDAHIISYNTLGIPNIAFLREGLAMFFDKGYLGIDNYSWVRYFLSKNRYISLNELIVNDKFHKTSHFITYTIAGAFAEYLICIFGVNKFKEFYSNVDDNFEECFKKTFKVSLKDFEEKFKKYVNILSRNKAIEKLIEKELS
ncbi:hypothetical protein [Paraclostridium sordellii]|uniref:Peptidase MA superfamily protein n=1 Tax=Paraclostridium sordellii TaxID=1505 RepID=A0A0C7G5K1_PARSO|nr:hypothetical protein [Paeniclostridium sordellii]CEN78235.1 Uncharacterised protein [[Clostridium] sordellii] [Paeniclostridium sordellii]CEQ03326.1 Uncharacterised protein [[Clostridium] sordellii] [Paeniclostridium sordellii]